jgi:hypothetical protein
MSVIQVGLVDTTGRLDAGLVDSVAAALNIQVMRDLPQYWNVKATVRHLPDPNKIPAGVWPVLLVDKLPPGEGGVHLDQNHQPYSLVIGSPDDDTWTIDASHETLEMLVDPWGNRFHTSRAIGISGGSIVDETGEFNYLVEACDPCEGNQYAYSIHGVAVSDFITPHFYDPIVATGTRYSFGGNIKKPRQVLPGGYISYVDTKKHEIEQILWVNPNQKPKHRNLGKATGASLRVFVDGETRQLVRESRTPNAALANDTKAHRAELHAAALARGQAFAAAYK